MDSMYQRYESETLKGALLKVKADMGPEAQILSQRQVRKAGISGLMGNKVWQIVARKAPPEDARDARPRPASAKPSTPSANPVASLKPPAPRPVPPNAPNARPAPSQSYGPTPQRVRVQQSVDHVIDEPALPFSELSDQPPASGLRRTSRPERRDPSSPLAHRAPEPAGIERTALRILVKEVRALSDKLNAAKTAPEQVILPGVLPVMYQRLMAQDVPRDLAVDLMTRLCNRATLDVNDEARTLEALEVLLAEHIPTVVLDQLFSSRRPRILVVVGPSGVGKTTTLAKIAMLAARDERQKLALVTLDTFRIAAAEQLKTYADLLPAQIEIVMSEEEFGAAVVRHADKDMILVDTPGKNPCSPAALSDLADYLKRLTAAKLPSPAILLALSATTKLSDLERYAACYRSLDPAAVVFTKLDETSTYGSMLPALHAARLPLAFVTCGQEMPEDIEPATGLRVARRILGR